MSKQQQKQLQQQLRKTIALALSTGLDQQIVQNTAQATAVRLSNNLAFNLSFKLSRLCRNLTFNYHRITRYTTSILHFYKYFPLKIQKEVLRVKYGEVLRGSFVLNKMIYLQCHLFSCILF